MSFKDKTGNKVKIVVENNIYKVNDPSLWFVNSRKIKKVVKELRTLGFKRK